jgi:hypothetical protein
MQECWHSDLGKRPHTRQICYTLAGINQILANERKNPTKIIKSPDIGPITTYNPGAIYKSRPLNTMIKSAESTRSSKSQNIDSEISK